MLQTTGKAIHTGEAPVIFGGRRSVVVDIRAWSTKYHCSQPCPVSIRSFCAGVSLDLRHHSLFDVSPYRKRSLFTKTFLYIWSPNYFKNSTSVQEVKQPIFQVVVENLPPGTSEWEETRTIFRQVFVLLVLASLLGPISSIAQHFSFNLESGIPRNQATAYFHISSVFSPSFFLLVFYFLISSRSLNVLRHNFRNLPSSRLISPS